MNYFFRGVVRGVDGNPVGRGDVRIVHEDCACGARNKTVYTNANGEYSIEFQIFGGDVVPHTLIFYNRDGDIIEAIATPVGPPNVPSGGFERNNIDLQIPPPPEEDGGEEGGNNDDGGGLGNASGSNEGEVQLAHHCGAQCTTKDGLCTRHTKNPGGCWQHPV